MRTKLYVDDKVLDVDIVSISGNTMYVALSVEGWSARDIVWLMHVAGNKMVADIDGRPVFVDGVYSIDTIRVKIALRFMPWVSKYEV